MPKIQIFSWKTRKNESIEWLATRFNNQYERKHQSWIWSPGAQRLPPNTRQWFERIGEKHMNQLLQSKEFIALHK